MTRDEWKMTAVWTGLVVCCLIAWAGATILLMMFWEWAR